MPCSLLRISTPIEPIPGSMISDETDGHSHLEPEGYRAELVDLVERVA